MFKNQIKTKKKGLLFFLSAILSLIVILSSFTVAASASRSEYDFAPKEVILGGVPFGVKFSTRGVMVIGFSDIDGLSKNQNPAYLAGLRAKDIITKVNGRKIEDAEDLIADIQQALDKI
jgi:stage IV sporulation protein B